MFHEEKETLDLLGKYSRKKEPIKIYPKEEKQQIKEKIIYRTAGQFNTKQEKSFFDMKIFIGGVAFLLILFLVLKINTINTINNPLLGKWRTSTIMGTVDIEFNNNTVTALGVTGKVKYEIKGNQILVIDEDLKIGTNYIIQNQDTMYTEMFGIKNIYKRIK